MRRLEPRATRARSSAPRRPGSPTAVFELDDHPDRPARDAAMADWLEEHDVDLVVLAGYMHLLTPAFLDRFPERIVNVHPSLLPAFPGAHAVEDQLAAGRRRERRHRPSRRRRASTRAACSRRSACRSSRATRGDAARAHPGGRAPAAADGGERAVPRALLSVYDKTGLDEFARGLAELGWELVASGGTATHLEGLGLDVTRVEEVTQAPEMLGGRVKTLHPRIHGAILARPDREDDRETLAEQEIVPFDLVCVNLYPFSKVAGSSARPRRRRSR